MSKPGDYFSLRVLGTTGLRVTPLSVGTAALGDMPEVFAYEVAEDEAVGMLREVFTGPINFVDTAASYGDGESERRIGNVLREIGGIPGGWVIGTKADRDLKTGDFSGAQMRKSVERSLDLLGLERLQLVHLHDAEHSTYESIMAPGGPVEVLLSMKEDQNADEDVVRRAYELERICDRYQVPLAAASLQFSLRDPRITSTIVGASRSGRIEQTLVLAAHEIPEEIWPELDRVVPTSVDPEVHRWN